MSSEVACMSPFSLGWFLFSRRHSCSSPLLWQTGTLWLTSATVVSLQVLGPEGKCVVTSAPSRTSRHRAFSLHSSTRLFSPSATVMQV